MNIRYILPLDQNIIHVCTEGCNMRCSTCPDTTLRSICSDRPLGDIVSDIDKVIDAMFIDSLHLDDVEDEPVALVFCGGEPLLQYKDIIDLIVELNKLHGSMRITICTNGSINVDNFIEEYSKRAFVTNNILLDFRVKCPSDGEYENYIQQEVGTEYPKFLTSPIVCKAASDNLFLIASYAHETEEDLQYIEHCKAHPNAESFKWVCDNDELEEI